MPDGRWRSFDYEELMKRDKESADDLQTALEQFTAIVEKIKG